MVKLNLGCGVALLGGFVNVDACFTREQLEEGIRTREGYFQNAVIEPGAEFVQADIRNLPFPDDYADYVLMNNVIEHLPMKDLATAMGQVHRVTKPGAELVVITPDFNCLARLWVEHIASKVGQLDNFETYNSLAQVIYGNQVGVGEYHSAPMTPDFLRMILLAAGFGEPEIRIYPMGAALPDDVDGAEYRPDWVNRTDNLLARTRKAPAALQASTAEKLLVESGMA